jgi:precorrin-6B methylase 2
MNQEADFISLEWLASHHFTKIHNRFHQVRRLPIVEGDHVLDLGCGPGFYTKYFCEMVGSKGKVTGVDSNPMSLDFAERYLAGFPYKNWRLMNKDMLDCIDELKQYNKIVIINAVGYLPNPIDTIRLFVSKMRKGSQLIIKDFDMGTIFIYPINNSFLTTLISHAERNNMHNNPLNFDNFFGRRVFNIHNKIDDVSYSNTLWAQGITSPFNDYEKRYIKGNIGSLVTQAQVSCPKEIITYFEKMILKNEDFFAIEDALFVEVEYVTALTVL